MQADDCQCYFVSGFHKFMYAIILFFNFPKASNCLVNRDVRQTA